VRSFEDKVFAIYNKYDNLLSMQADRMANDASTNSKNSVEVAKFNELNKQKMQFSTEMERELNENFNFEEISSNPDLVKRFKQLYDLVKKNSSSESEKEKTVSSKSFNSLTDKRPPLPNSIPKLTVNQDKVKSESISNPSGIREIYSIVNSFSRTLSFNNQNFEDFKQASSSGADSNETTLGRDENIYRIPLSLSDKINTIVTPLLRTEENGNDEAGSTLTSDKKPNKFASFINEQERVNEFELSSKLKVNKVNKLDSVGNESTSSNSIDIDNNSLNYNYDQKYKYDQSKNSIVRLIFKLFNFVAEFTFKTLVII
jgi:hypothetical protein